MSHTRAPANGMQVVKTRRTSRLSWSRQGWLGYLLVAPLMLWLAGTILYPLFSAIRISFLDVGIIGTGGNFVGLDNYTRILGSDKFWSALGRSLVWVVSNAVLQTFAAFITAVILKQRFRGQGLARIWVILSWIVPTVVVVIIWRWLLGTSGGIVNYALVSLGIVDQPVGFFSSGSSSMNTLIFINSWRWFPLMALICWPGCRGLRMTSTKRPRSMGRPAGSASGTSRSRPCNRCSSCWAWSARCGRSTCST